MSTRKFCDLCGEVLLPTKPTAPFTFSLADGKFVVGANFATEGDFCVSCVKKVVREGEVNPGMPSQKRGSSVTFRTARLETYQYPRSLGVGASFTSGQSRLYLKEKCPAGEQKIFFTAMYSTLTAARKRGILKSNEKGVYEILLKPTAEGEIERTEELAGVQ